MAEEASKKRKWKSVGHLLYAMIPVVALASMLIFGGLYLREYFQYKAAKEEYAALADAYIQDGEGTYGSSARSTVTENAGEGSAQMQQDSGASLESGRSTNSDHAFTKGDASMNSRSGQSAPHLCIDYDALLRMNPDFVCVLYIPALKLRYPVVYSKDNADYLHTTFEGKHNAAGAIFYDCTSPKDFRGENTYLFGHNMKNGSMFGTLKKFEKDAALCSSDPYIYIYTKDHVRTYRIFSYYETVDGSASYDDFSGTAGYDQYVAYCLKNSRAALVDTAVESTAASADADKRSETQEKTNSTSEDGSIVRKRKTRSASESTIDFAERPQLLTLSTCSGRAGGNQRFVVHAALIGVE